MIKTSIMPGTTFLLLLVVVDARTVWNNFDDSALQPILSQSQKTRICSELCLSGLGGTPCGDSCLDLIPPNLGMSGQDGQDKQSGGGGGGDTSSGGGGTRYNSTARKDSCDVLCKNRLGYPLCGCTYDATKPYDTNYLEICTTFCVDYGYQLYGCQNCSIYIQYVNSQSADSSSPFDTASLDIGSTVSWSGWCREVCSDGNGGAACKCDLLP